MSEPATPTDDQILTRMRSALDELTADVADDSGGLVPLRPAATRPGRRGAWLGAAAATVLLACGAMWALSTRTDDPVASPATVPPSAPPTALAATTLPGDTTPPMPADVGAPSYSIVSARLAPGAIAVEEVPNASDALVQVWRVEGEGLDGFLRVSVTSESLFGSETIPGATVTELSGFPDGTARLIVSADASRDTPSDPAVEWTRSDGAVWTFDGAGLVRPGADEAWLDLVRSAVPGSGLPIVIPDERATSIGVSGLSTAFVRQEYTGVDGGTVASALTDSLLFFGGISGVIDVESTTVAGRAGWRMTVEGEAVTVIWDAGDGWYGLLGIPSPLSANADDIIAAVVRTDAAPPAETVPTPETAQLYVTTAFLIQSADGPPMIAYGFRGSLPPQGGAVELAGLDWADVPSARTMGGTTWTDTLHELTGTFDGTVFTLTEPPQQEMVNEPMPTPTTIASEVCTTADLQPVIDAVNSLDLASLGVISTATERADGRCVVLVRAVVDTPELRAALTAWADQVRVEFAIAPL
jgi:hypothetical protein